MSNAWEVDARLGVYEGKTSTGITTIVGKNPPYPGSDSKTSASLVLGVGGSYTVSEHLALRLDYVRLNQVSDKIFGRAFNVDFVTAGLTYAF
jgi:opacity protein-like surface antigen